jgi:penicillin-binding protein 2
VVEKKNQNTTRLIFFAGFICILYLILICRLFTEQVLNKNYFDKSVSAQCVRRIRIPGLRGRIFSSDGKVLADNLPSYDIEFYLNEMKVPRSRSRTIDNILKHANKVANAINRKLTLTKLDITKHINMQPALPITIFSNLTSKELAVAEELTPPIKGMEIATSSIRYYPDPINFSNILGYARKQSPGQAEDRSDYSYYIPDLIGKSGLEKEIDSHINMGSGIRGLKGLPGCKLLEIDVKGYEHDNLGISHTPLNGNSVKLTINWRLQRIAQKIMADKVGAVVVEEANTGAVLALVSSPEYNIADFQHGISSKKWKEILANPGHPLFNRPLMGTYMPGSIIKIITAIAAIKNGIDPNKSIYCDSYIKIGDAKIRSWDWRYGARGNIDMAEALKISNNPYFIQIGLQVGLPQLIETYKLCGLGQKTDIGLPEKVGLIPSPELKKRQTGRRWTKFDTALVTFGQGRLLITPMQAANYISAIANGGSLYKPYLIKDVYTPAGRKIYQNIPQIKNNLNITREELAPIYKGMYEDVNQAGGTARQAQNNYITLYGKTGTAQVWEHHKIIHNTWFAAFGKYKSHTYTIVILVENGKHGGGGTSGTIAKQIFNEWLAPQSKDTLHAS